MELRGGAYFCSLMMFMAAGVGWGVVWCCMQLCAGAECKYNKSLPGSASSCVARRSRCLAYPDDVGRNRQVGPNTQVLSRGRVQLTYYDLHAYETTVLLHQHSLHVTGITPCYQIPSTPLFLFLFLFFFSYMPLVTSAKLLGHR